VASSKRPGKSGEARGGAPGSSSKKKGISAPNAGAKSPSKAVVTSPWRNLALRIGVPVAVLWVIGGILAGIWTSSVGRAVVLGTPALLTVAGLVLVVWAMRQTGRAKAVASVLSNVETAADRKAALEKLNQDFGKKDPAAIFAKAQLKLQEDPQEALRELEQIDLSKVLPTVADEARAQRAMIYLLLGQVSMAKPLADGIDLKRHEDARARAMMVAIVGETWARSGQAKRALESLELYDPDEDTYEQVRPQLWRARAYACAYTDDMRGMRRALRRLVDQDARILAGFLGKKTHPMLQREAKRMLEQSGAIPRKVVYQRS
jgi:hypothetical protein